MTKELEVLTTYQHLKSIPQDRKIESTRYFPPKDTFGAIYSAIGWAKEKGFSVGSMQRDYPIAIADAEKYGYISKWFNIGEDIGKIGGVIIPDGSFREGGALAIIFEDN